MSITARNKRNISFAMSGMTDIVFLLLIFFMLVSTLIVPGVLNVELPASNNQTIASPEVNVSLTRNMEYFIDGEPVLADEVETSLRSLISQKDVQPVTVRLNADENLSWDQVTRFIEIAKRVKFKVILGTKPE
ncbi:MAG: biopolymer transporter ExbD [Bacteroidales bacterium]|nr:biopolymer transporter ExbD [Bacteroidales bacterium]